MSEAKMELTDDRSAVLITFPGVRPVQVSLNAVELDQMLGVLGDFRMKMLPQVPENWIAGQHVSAVLEPQWMVETTAAGHASVCLHVRDPRFGWLHFCMSNGMAKSVSKALVEGTQGFSRMFNKRGH